MTKNFEQKDNQEKLLYGDGDKDIVENITRGRKKHKDKFPEKAEKSMEKTLSDAESYNKILEQKMKFKNKLISAADYINAIRNSQLYKKIPETIRKEIEEERNNSGKKDTLSDKQVISFMELMVQDPNFVDKITDAAKQVDWEIQQVRVLWDKIVLIWEKDKKAIPFFYPWNIFRDAAQLWSLVVKRICTKKKCAIFTPKNREIIWVRRREWLNRASAKFEKQTPIIQTDTISDSLPSIKPVIETVKNQEIWVLSFAVAESDTGEKIDTKTVQKVKWLPENSILTVESSVDYREAGPKKQIDVFNELIKNPILANLIAQKKISWFEETRQLAFKEALEKRGNALLWLNRALRLINEMATKTDRVDINYKIKTMVAKKPAETEERKNLSNDERETILGRGRFARFTADFLEAKENDLDLSLLGKITEKITDKTTGADILISLPHTDKMLKLDYSRNFSNKLLNWKQNPDNKWAIDYLATKYGDAVWTRQFFQFAQSVSIIWKNLVDKGVDPVKHNINFLKADNTEDQNALAISMKGKNETIIEPVKNPYLNSENLTQK